ncbi:unnamed protein product [Auanema sp. JU1783]|nr:unnamed protein product [Auanema sp. JU1783]
MFKQDVLLQNRIMHKGTAGTIVQSSSNSQIEDSRRSIVENSNVHNFSQKFNEGSRVRRQPFQMIPTRSIVVDPIFVDLDNFQNFNDISESMNFDEEFLATPPPPFIPVTVEDELLETSFSESPSILRAQLPNNPRISIFTTTTPAPVTSTTTTTTTTTEKTPALVPTTLKIFEDRRTQIQRTSDFSSHFPTPKIEDMTVRTTLPTSSTFGMRKFISTSPFPIPMPMVIPDEDDDIDSSESDSSRFDPESEEGIPSFPIKRDDKEHSEIFSELTTTTERTTMNPLWWTPRPAFIGQTSVQLLQKKQEENKSSRPIVQLSLDQQTSPKRLSQWGRTQPLEERLPKSRYHNTENTVFVGLPTKKTLSLRPHRLPSVSSRSSFPSSSFKPQSSQGSVLTRNTGNVAEKEILKELESLASRVHLNDLKNVFQQKKKHSDFSNWNRENVDNELVSKRNALRQLELLKDLHEKHIMRNLPHLPIASAEKKMVPKDIDELDLALKELGLSVEDSHEDSMKNINVLGEKRTLKQGLSRKSISSLTSRYRIHKMNSGVQIFERNAQDRNLVHGYGYSGRKLNKLNKSKAFRAVPPSSPQRIYSVPGSELLPSVARSEVKSVEQLVHSLKRRDDASNVCQLAKCSFEEGDLCNWESSYDETTRVRRTKRENLNDEKFFVMRSWSNWLGHNNTSVITIDKAPIFNELNKHFAGIVLNAQQRGSLTLRLNHEESFKLRFRGYDVRPATKLKVCCDESCFVSNRDPEQHRWKKLQVECPARTQQISFECMSGGPYRGACGVDDISIYSDICT